MKTYTITLKDNAQDALANIYQIDPEAIIEDSETHNVTVKTVTDIDALLDTNDDVVSYSVL